MLKTYFLAKWLILNYDLGIMNYDLKKRTAIYIPYYILYIEIFIE